MWERFVFVKSAGGTSKKNERASNEERNNVDGFGDSIPDQQLKRERGGEREREREREEAKT